MLRAAEVMIDVQTRNTKTGASGYRPDASVITKVTIKVCFPLVGVRVQGGERIGSDGPLVDTFLVAVGKRVMTVQTTWEESQTTIAYWAARTLSSESQRLLAALASSGKLRRMRPFTKPLAGTPHVTAARR